MATQTVSGIEDNDSGRDITSFGFEEQVASILARNSAVQLLVEPVTTKIVATNLAANHFYALSLANLNLRDITPHLPNLTEWLHYPLTTFQGQQTTPAGATYQVIITAAPLSIHNQPYLLLVIQDNRSRNQLEQKVSYQDTVLNQIVDAIIIADPHFVIQSWNKAAEEIYGWTAQEVIGKQAATLFQSQFPDGRSRDEINQQLVKNGFWRGEISQRRKNGRPIHIISSATLIKDESGNITNMIAVNRDITARKMAEKALIENERRFRQLIETSQATPFETDPEIHQIAYVGPQAAHLLGYPIEAWYSPNFFQRHIHPEDRPHVAQQRQEAMKNQLEYDFEYRVITISGEFVWLREIGTIVHDSNQSAKLLGFWVNITERKLYQFQLEASEKRFRALVEKSTDAFSLLDEQANILYASPSITTMLGYSLQEFIGQNAFSFSHPDEFSQNRAIFETILQAPGQSVSTTLQFRHQNGSWRWVEVSATNLLTDINVQGIVVNFRDITEQYLIQGEIRQSEQKYRQLFASAQHQAQEVLLLNQISVALAPTLELGQIYRTIVDLISHTFGYALASLYILEGDVLVVQHLVGYTDYLDQIPLSRGIMGLVARTGRAILVEDVTTDPIYVAAIEGVVSEICVPVFDEQQVVGVLNVESTDNVPLTAEDLQIILAVAAQASTAIGRARLYSEVRENEERFRMLLENSTDLIALLNSEGVIIYASPSTERVLGYGLGRYSGRVFTDFVHSDDLPELRFLMANLLIRSGSQTTTQYRMRHQNGSWRWIEATVTNLLHQSNVQAVIMNYRDITERWRAEEALRQAQKMEGLGVLAGGVAHDFNNLLTAMMSQISLASLQLPAASPLRPHIDKARMAAERAADLTRQLLAYSGREQLEMKPVQLNSLIQENLHLFSVAIPKHIALQLNLAEPLPTIDGDLGQIQQIIMNLLINAVEAVGDRPGQVTVTTGIQSVQTNDTELAKFTGTPLFPGEYVLLQIRDSGHGMDETTLSRIFDPFFTTKFTGRGLGLSAVLGIVRGHRGGLTVESRFGQGTTFHIVFPAGQTQFPLAPPPMSIQSKPIPSRTLLVIDDEYPIREAITDIMALARIPVIVAYDGLNGLALFQQHQAEIGLVLLDLSMPGLSGEETLAHLLTLDPHIKIILSSGYSQSEVRNLLTNQRIVAFLQKPFGFQELIEIVQKHL